MWWVKMLVVLDLRWISVVLCNLATPQLRTKSFAQDQSTLAKGFSVFSLLFALAWSWSPMAYLRGGDSSEHLGGRDFYPGFTLLNSWMGVFYFVFSGFCGSRRFQALVKSIGRKKQKEEKFAKIFEEESEDTTSMASNQWKVLKKKINMSRKIMTKFCDELL